MTRADRVRAAAHEVLAGGSPAAGWNRLLADAIAAGIEAALGPEVTAKNTRALHVRWGETEAEAAAREASTLGGATPEPSDADRRLAECANDETQETVARRFARVRADGRNESIEDAVAKRFEAISEAARAEGRAAGLEEAFEEAERVCHEASMEEQRAGREQRMFAVNGVLHRIRAFAKKGAP